MYKKIKIYDEFIICEKGLKLRVVDDCFDESYLHEITYYWRPGLKEKTLKKGDIVEVVECWSNFHGTYIRCTFNNKFFDIKPYNLSINVS